MKLLRGDSIKDTFIIDIGRAIEAEHFIDLEIFRIEVDFTNFTYKAIFLEIEILGVSLEPEGIHCHAECVVLFHIEMLRVSQITVERPEVSIKRIHTYACSDFIYAFPGPQKAI